VTDWSGGDVFDLGPSGAIAAAEYALSRFTEVGVDIPRENRLVRSQRLLGDVNAKKVELGPDDPALIRRVTAAQWTALDFYLVARATGQSVGSDYVEKVRLALGGADVPENDTNHLHRNTHFELLVAAFLAMGDVPVVLSEPDLVVRLDSRDIGVAAKRVQNTSKIRRRMKDAQSQIARSGRDGLIAVNVDAILLNSKPVGDANEKGQTVDEKLKEVHRADDELIHDVRVVGRVAFARTAQWSFSGGHPMLQQDMFRQYQFYARDEGEADGLIAEVGRAESLIESRLQRL